MRNHHQLQTVEESSEAWVSGHLYYHENLDIAVQSFVRPLVTSLHDQGKIDGFFFIRYALGGPHIRLRLRTKANTIEYVTEAMSQSAKQFLKLRPSTQHTQEETIRRINQSLLAADPTETDDAVYPDNWFRLAPFTLETQRYGGPSLLRLSLDFFILSSVAAVEFCSKYGTTKRSTQLTNAIQLLLQQAIGFAANRTELADLLRYGVDSFGERMPTIIERADRTSKSQASLLGHLLKSGLATAHSTNTSPRSLDRILGLLSLGACMLSVASGASDRQTRMRIGNSNLHMTANRLGLSNAEEAYVSRLLTMTLQDMSVTATRSPAWRPNRAKSSGECPAAALSDLVPKALTALKSIFVEPLTPASSD